MLEAFYDRLRHLCADDGEGAGLTGERLIEWQAKHTRALAYEWEILKEVDFTWDQWKSEDPNVKSGTEHIFEQDSDLGLIRKTTIPGKFGLMPHLVRHAVINLRANPNPPEYHWTLEARAASPLEYLQRWIDANDVFGDDVRLVSAIEWADGQLSFGITQPQYNGEPASDREIEEYFEDAGWKFIPDPTRSGHLLFFHYGWGMLAYDAAGRNCFVHDDALMPFDVILCRPEDDLADFLRLYH